LKTVKDLRGELTKFPDSANCYAAELGITVVSEGSIPCSPRPDADPPAEFLPGSMTLTLGNDLEHCSHRVLERPGKGSGYWLCARPGCNFRLPWSLPTHTHEATGELVEERLRQISSEGFDTAHDDEHHYNQLARAAACYANPIGWNPSGAIGAENLPMGWPWHATWWKPKDRERDLIRAGALIIAELERLMRLKK
jgi:hypothetical protein